MLSNVLLNPLCSTRVVQGLMEMSEFRGIVARFVRDEPAPYSDLQVANETIQTMCQEAAEYGLTAVDVVRAILRPVFEKKRGCDCPTLQSSAQ